MKLDQIQAKLSAFLCSESGEPAADLVGEVVAPYGLSARASLDIYRDGLTAKNGDRLGGTFQKLAALLGPATFLVLVQEHFHSCRIEDRSIELLVQRLPSFLEGGERFGRRDLADLAVLELARRDVADEPADAVSADALVRLATAEWSGATLRLVPALRMVPLRFAVADVWDRLDAGEPPPPPVEAPSTVLVWRCGGDVLHSSLPDDEADALGRIRRGMSLDHVVEAFVSCPDAAQAAYDALTSWFEDGLIAGVDVPAARRGSS